MNLNRWIKWKHRHWRIVNSKWLECVWDWNIDPIPRHVAEDRNGHGLPRVTYYSFGCAEQRCCWYDWCTGERLSKHLLTRFAADALMLSTSTPSLHVSLHVSLHFSTALCATYFMPDAKHGAMGACVQERLEKRLVEPSLEHEHSKVLDQGRQSIGFW